MATGARWVGFSLVAAVLLVVLGVALAVVVARVNQSVADTLTLRSSVLQASGDQLGLWNDQDKTEPVAALRFRKLRIQPPLRSIGPDMPRATVFVENTTTGDLYLVQPCGDIESPPGTVIGTMDAVVHTLGGDLLGNTCDVPATVIVASGDLLRVELRIELVPGLATGDYPFQAVFEAVSAAAIPPPAGLVSWWPGDGHPSDIIGGNHGLILGSATYAPGMVEQAFSLDGVADFVLVSDGIDLNITGDVTVDLWARRTVIGGVYRDMVFKGAGAIAGSDAPTVYALGFTTDNQLRGLFERADASNVVVTGPTVTDSLFHHYAYVRFGNTHKLFMDGDEVKSETFTGSPGDTSGLPLVIGAARHDPGGFFQYFGGIIDEVEIFNRALTAEEIRAIYEAGSAGKIKPAPPPPPEPVPLPAGMVGWWPGDEHPNDIMDGNDGTLGGGTSYENAIVDQGFSLDGVDDRVVVADSINLNITGDVTVDLWARRTVIGGGYRDMVFKGAGAIAGSDEPTVYGMGFTSDNRLRGFFERANASNVDIIGPTVTDPLFHHYAYVRIGNTHKLFMDGDEVKSETFTGGPGDTSGLPLVIGAVRHDPGGFIQYFGGIIDEVEIFNRALTAEEIRAIYDAGSAGKIKPP